MVKTYLVFILTISTIIGCKQEEQAVFNVNAEPLSITGEVAIGGWIGYGNFRFDLEDITANFSKDYVVSRSKKLQSNARSVQYSMPSVMRSEIMGDIASDLVEATVILDKAIAIKTEDEIKKELDAVIKIYLNLNKEINLQFAN